MHAGRARRRGPDQARQHAQFRISTTRPSPRSVAPDDAVDLDQRVGHRPHDDLALSDDAIDRDADRVEARADDERVQRAPRPLGNAEQPAEPDDRQHAAADTA